MTSSVVLTCVTDMKTSPSVLMAQMRLTLALRFLAPYEFPEPRFRHFLRAKVMEFSHDWSMQSTFFAGSARISIIFLAYIWRRMTLRGRLAGYATLFTSLNLYWRSLLDTLLISLRRTVTLASNSMNA